MSEISIDGKKLKSLTIGDYTWEAGSDPVIESKTITENGTYVPSSGVDGFNPVVVNVQGAGDDQFEKLITNTITSINTSVSFIAPWTFVSRTNLTEVSFPQCVSIGNNAFENCNNLSSMYFPVCTTIGKEAFRWCSKITELSLSTVVAISDDTFYNCTSLTTVSLPMCTSMGSYNQGRGNGPFRDCIRLASVYLPRVTTVTTNAFQNNAISIITESDFTSVSTIYGGAFFQNRTLTEATFPNLTTTEKSNYGKGPFANCNKMSKFSAPLLSSVCGGTFCSCYALTSVYIPACERLDDDGSGTFGKCSALSEISLLMCSFVGYNCFSDCTNLTTVNLPSATAIGNTAFYRCSNLTTLTLTANTMSQIKAMDKFPWAITNSACQIIGSDGWVDKDGNEHPNE